MFAIEVWNMFHRTRMMNVHAQITVWKDGIGHFNERHKLFICDRRFTSDQICVYPDRKNLIDGALPKRVLSR